MVDGSISDLLWCCSLLPRFRIGLILQENGNAVEMILILDLLRNFMFNDTSVKVGSHHTQLRYQFRIFLLIRSPLTVLLVSQDLYGSLAGIKYEIYTHSIDIGRKQRTRAAWARWFTRAGRSVRLTRRWWTAPSPCWQRTPHAVLTVGIHCDSLVDAKLAWLSVVFDLTLHNSYKTYCLLFMRVHV